MKRHVRRFAAIAVALAVGGAVLTACSSPLVTKDIELTAGTSPTTDLLVGDKVTVNGTAKVLHGKSDKVRVEVQQSTDGKTWTAVKTSKATARKATVTVEVPMKAAGSVELRSQAFAAGKKKPLQTTEPIKAQVADIKTLIRTFYYDETQADASSAQAGADWSVAHAYPGTSDPNSAKGKANLASEVSNDIRESDVPDLTTISETPTWTFPGDACSSAGTTPPKGRTFIVTLERSIGIGAADSAPTKADGHVTYLDGKLYNYPSFCY